MITQTTLRPGQKGTKRLAKKYGERLVCVRYRYDQATGRRYTTVELIEEEIERHQAATIDSKQDSPGNQERLGVRIGYEETELRDKVKAAGGIWRPRYKLWELPYQDVVALGLESRVVGAAPTES